MDDHAAIENFDFTKGGIVGNISFPPLRPLQQAEKHRSEQGTSEFVVYEPGNGTRYEVVFARRGKIPGEIVLDPADDYFPRTFVAVVNFGRRSMMALPAVKKLGLHNIDFICGKMDLMTGDVYALIPLINDFLERHKDE